MPHPNEELVRSFYGAFARGDVDHAIAMTSETVVFHQPGHNRTTGDYRGRDEVLKLLRLLGELTVGTFRAAVHDVIAGAEHAVGLLRITAQRDGQSLDVPVVHVMHIDKRRIQEVWVHTIDVTVLDDFWGR